MTPKEIVAALGGPTAVGRALSVPVSTVATWGRDGSRGCVPAWHVAPLLRIAREQSVTLTVEDLVPGLRELAGEVP
jgi:hypothetical protein